MAYRDMSVFSVNSKQTIVRRRKGERFMRGKITMVTEVRIIIASTLESIAAIFSINKLLNAGIVAVSETVLIILPIYFNAIQGSPLQRGETNCC